MSALFTDVLLNCFGRLQDRVAEIQDRNQRCIYEMGESSYGAGDSLPCGQLADDSGFCEKHRGEMGI